MSDSKLTEEQQRWTERLIQARGAQLAEARKVLDDLEESGERATITVAYDDRHIDMFEKPTEREILVPEGPERR